MNPDVRDKIIRLRIPAALQLVMALDIAIVVLLAAIAVFAALFLANGDWLADVGGLLLGLAAYVGCGLWISVMLGRASPVARVGQVLWSGLWLVYVVWGLDAAGVDGSWGAWSTVPMFLLAAPIISLGLLFTPSVRAFFATVRAARARDET